jgi:hypothetical protein
MKKSVTIISVIFIFIFIKFVNKHNWILLSAGGMFLYKSVLLKISKCKVSKVFYFSQMKFAKMRY